MEIGLEILNLSATLEPYFAIIWNHATFCCIFSRNFYEPSNLLGMTLLQQWCNKIMCFFALEQCTQQGSSRRQREQNNRANIGLSGWRHPITSRPLPTLTSPKMLAFHPDALITTPPLGDPIFKCSLVQSAFIIFYYIPITLCQFFGFPYSLSLLHS